MMMVVEAVQPPLINILYKYNELTSVEILWNDDQQNTNTHCLVNGFIRNICNKTTIIPQEINQTIFAFALFVPIKYELNIYKGNLDGTQLLEIKYEIKYVQSHDANIAFCHLVLLDIPQSDETGYNTKMFAIRARAILTEKSASSYSLWLNFETASKRALEDPRHARTYNDLEQTLLDSRESLTYFWNKCMLKQNQTIKLKQWLNVWKKLNIEEILGLNEYELKRIYYFLLTKPGNTKIGEKELFDFIKPESFIYRSDKFKPGFVCKQWIDLKKKIAMFIFEYFRELTLDFDELESSCKYKGGYNNSHQTIVWFWQILHSLDGVTEEQFLAFLSSGNKPPRRNKQIQLMIEKATGDNYKGNQLPTTRVIYSKYRTVLFLPAYVSKELMKQQLMQAITKTSSQI